MKVKLRVFASVSLMFFTAFASIHGLAYADEILRTDDLKVIKIPTSSSPIESHNMCEELKARCDALIKSECEWIACIQSTNGAIPMTKISGSGTRVNPYFANYAILGVLIEKGPNPCAARYLSWLLSHNNADATIYDYQINADGEEHSLGHYDSADSYASTSISAIRKYCEQTGDFNLIIDKRPTIKAICDLIVSLQDNDGLTYASNSYKVRYLMDNCESYKGLQDAEWLFRNVYKEDSTADTYGTNALRLKSAINEKFWDKKTGLYQYYYEGNGVIAIDLNRFYPDATAQLFPILFGIIDPNSESAKHIYQLFNSHYPEWPKLKKDDEHFPWALVVNVAAVMGDFTRVNEYLKSAEEVYVSKGHPWPWYCMESGMTILAAKNVLNSFSH